MAKINVAIIGVGNCASSLIQGVHFYRNVADDATIPGIRRPNLGGYHIGDIQFVAAFDIDKNKVGKHLAEAIYAPPNNTYKFCDVPATGVKVQRGMTHDGLGKYLSQIITRPRDPRPTLSAFSRRPRPTSLSATSLSGVRPPPIWQRLCPQELGSRALTGIQSCI